MSGKPFWGAAFVLLPLALNGASFRVQTSMAPLTFDFGPGKAAPGYTRVPPAALYAPERGYGYEPGASVSGDKPFLFSAAVPEGNYHVTVTLGDPADASATTVKAEARRLVLENVTTAAGRFTTRTFTVNVRRPTLRAGDMVRLKADEQGHRNWDDRLTLEFSGARPRLAAVAITRAEEAVTVYLAGDSTVTDQGKEPWSAWGQMLPRFFAAGVAVANHAESGESLKSFVAEKRLEKIRDTIKAGDYLFIQFAHNDQKPGSSHVEPFTTYKEQLKRYIGAAREHGAIPVLVTSMHRRRFDPEGRIVNTLGDYPEAMRQTARAENVPLIDLNARSRTLFEALGPEGTRKAFVHYPAGTFPGQEQALKDDTHFSAYGAYQLARCVVEGIRAGRLGIASYLTDDLPPFDPARPDPPNNL